MNCKLSEADAARVAAIHAEKTAIYRRDRGCGLEAKDEVRIDVLNEQLRKIRDAQYGVDTRMVLSPAPRLRKPRRKLPRMVAKNLCHCDLERMIDDAAPAAGFAADGRLVVNTVPVKPPRMPRARSVQTLCPGCHLPHLFEIAFRWGKSPVEYVTVFHGFTVDHDAAEWLEAKYAEWRLKR